MVRKGKDQWLHLWQVIHYAKTGTYLSSVSDSEKSGIRKSAKNFLVEGESVYYCHEAEDTVDHPVKKRLVITTKEEVKPVLEDMHNNQSHQGIVRTQQKVTNEYYWPHVTEDVKKWVKDCPKCQSSRKVKTHNPEVHPIKVEGRWEVLCVDLIGPFTMTAKGNRYVLTLTDLFTKWVVAYPLKDGTGASVAKAIVKMIYTHGPPVKILADQGQEFVNEVNKNVLAVVNVKELVTSAYNPQEESTCQIQRTAIAKCCSEKQNDWDQFLRSVVYGINTSRQKLTKHSPFFLMYLRHPKGPHTINDIHRSQEGESCYELDQDEVQLLIQDAVELSAAVDKDTTAASLRLSSTETTANTSSMLGLSEGIPGTSSQVPHSKATLTKPQSKGCYDDGNGGASPGRGAGRQQQDSHVRATPTSHNMQMHALMERNSEAVEELLTFMKEKEIKEERYRERQAQSQEALLIQLGRCNDILESKRSFKRKRL